MKNKNNKKYVYGFMALALLTMISTAVPAFAQTTTPPAGAPNGGWAGHGGFGHRGGTMRPGVFGTVTAVSGNTITVDSKKGFDTTATDTTYTVDATNATITKSGATGTIASIVVGDTIVAQGTLTGTNLVATTVHDGVMRMHGASGTTGTLGTNANTNNLSNVVGNGQPVVAGAVTAISGNTISITNKSNVSYTVDATNAKITKDNATVAISSITVGDEIIAQGTINGNAVVASNIIDQVQPVANTSTTTTGTATQHKGFFGSIGSFFARIFGF
jgi:hypothetical protein